MCPLFYVVFRVMNTFRFTGQPVSRTAQRPFVMSPPQLSLTPSPHCFIMHPPPPNHMIGPIPIDLLPAPPLLPPSCGMDVMQANNAASSHLAGRPDHMVGQIPVDFPVHAPSLLPTSPPLPSTCLYATIPISAGAYGDPPFQQFTPAPTYSAPAITSHRSAPTVSGSTISSSRTVSYTHLTLPTNREV